MRIRNVKHKKEILENCNNVVDNPKEYKGKWNKYFNNKNPIYIEIGSGKCRFIIENAKRNPDINFIGIERIDSVLALGIKDNENLPNNLVLINYNAEDIEQLFIKEIDKLYLNFSDPWPKERHAKRRLTSSVFLTKYEEIFKNNKVIEFKTDNRGLFEYSIIEFVKQKYNIDYISLDLHNCVNNDNIMTEYEEKFSKKGYNIYMIKVSKK